MSRQVRPTRTLQAVIDLIPRLPANVRWFKLDPSTGALEVELLDPAKVLADAGIVEQPIAATGPLGAYMDPSRLMSKQERDEGTFPVPAADLVLDVPAGMEAPSLDEPNPEQN